MVKLDERFGNILKEYLQLKELDEKTIKKYMEFYNKFRNIYTELNQDNIDTFLKYNKSSPARSMVKHLISSIKRNKNLPVEMKVGVTHIDIPVITGKKETKVPKFINKIDIDRLDYGIKLYNPLDTERLKLMILVQFYGGLRVSELLNLSYENLKIEESEGSKKYQTILISSESAKFGKARNAYIPTTVYNRLKVWLIDKIRDSKKRFEKDKSFWGIKESRYRELLSQKTLEILGVQYNTHSLRHGRGTNLLKDEGKNINFIKKYLGHSDIKSTQVYTHFEDADVKKELET